MDVARILRGREKWVFVCGLEVQGSVVPPFAVAERGEK